MIHAGGKPRPVSIRDVAEACGVSLTTVSLILNKADRRISQATRERVLAKIAELGYRPNRLAQGLQKRRSRILAILVPQLSHTFADVYFGELISGIYDRASADGYKIMLEAAGPGFVEDRKYLDLYESCYIDGMLFMGSHDRHTFVRDLGAPERPFLLVNNVMPEQHYVVADYAMAGRLAAAHLVALGHRRIGLIHGAEYLRTSNDLKAAFLDELGARGVVVPASHLVDGLYTEQGGAAAVETLLNRVPDLTAVFAGNDKMALGAMQRLQVMGRQVPREISIMGCDDIHQSAFATPALTTVATPLFELGQRCCDRLIAMLRGRIKSCREVMPVSLRERDSTAPAAAGASR